MAFSTQKEFFHVPFMNEIEELDCLESCVKLKWYPSSIDDRSWAASQVKKSRFVADLIACNSPVFGKRSDKKKTEPTSFSPEEEYGSSLLLKDSLINAADDTIKRMQDIMIKNNMLQQKLDESDEKIETIHESTEIQRILSQRFNQDKSNHLKKKIKELSDEKKIDPEDENELNDLQRSIEDLIKANYILEAENSNLKRIIEKQSLRCKLDSIKVDPEKSTDIQYLQNKINDMGKEVALLRKTENELMKKYAKLNEVAISNVIIQENGFLPEKDVSNIQRILAERDALRKKCKNLEALGDKINELEQKANEAENVSGNLEDNLNEQNQYINEMQQEMEDMQNYYENEVDKAKGNEEMLKCRCDQMKRELLSAKCSDQRIECQQLEIEVLRNELEKRNIALNAYDCQYQQLMNVICELNQRYGNQRGECPSMGPCALSECPASQPPDIGEDLAFYTGATLDHIMNELCKQADCFKGMNEKRSLGDPLINSLDDCNRELERLRDMLKQKESKLRNLIEENGCLCEAVEQEKNELSNSMDSCNRELKRMTDLLKLKDGQLGELIDENDCLCEAAEISKKKLDDLDYQVQKLDEDTRYMEQGIVESIGLIQDIGDVAQENERLKGQMSNLKDSEAKQLLDDLSKQLQDCQDKSRLLQDKNNALGDALRELGINPSDIESKVMIKKKEEYEGKLHPGTGTGESDTEIGREAGPHTGADRQGVPDQLTGADSRKGRRTKDGQDEESEAGQTGRGEESAASGDGPSGVQTSGTTPLPGQGALQGPGTGGPIEGGLSWGPGVAPSAGAGAGPGAGQAQGISPSVGKESAQGLGQGSEPVVGKGTASGIEQGPGTNRGQGVGKEGGAGKGPGSGGPVAETPGAPPAPGAVTGAGPLAEKGQGPAQGPEAGGPIAGGPASGLGAGRGKEQAPASGPGAAGIGHGAETEAGPGAGAGPGPGVGAASRAGPGTKAGPGAENSASPAVGQDGAGKRAEQGPGVAQGPGSTQATGTSQEPGATPAKGIGTEARQEPGPGAFAGKREGQGGQGGPVAEKPGAPPAPGAGTGTGPLAGKGSSVPGASRGQGAGDLAIDANKKSGRRPSQSAGSKGLGSLATVKRISKTGGAGKTSKTGRRDSKIEGESNEGGTGASASTARRSLGSSKLDKYGKKGRLSSSRCRDEGQFDEFVRHTVQSLSAGDIDGCGLERELRKILDMFVDECGFCFCKCNIPKSRFYAICHKLYHHGLHTLDFKELAYMHKRIYAAAENILPGCLFNMIVKDVTALNCGVVDSPNKQKCCSCKNTMCCDANEEKLMRKVMRLETDIENAKICLKNLKSIPSRLSVQRCRLDGGDSSLISMDIDRVKPHKHLKAYFSMV